MRSSRFGLLLLLCLLVATLGGACGGGSDGSAFTGGDASVSDGSGDGAASGSGSDGKSLFGDAPSGDAPSGTLVIAPANKTIVVQYGTTMPTVPFTATENGAGVNASFTVDLGQIAGIVASTGVLTPTGLVGGTANVTATFGAQMATTKVTVVVQLVDNGGPTAPDGGVLDAGGGAGGNGGVGGQPPAAP